ncbi:MAG: copper resistance system multicopper oxidase [Proteobacteria bacterium]|nr:copper resistance system multicopper oxidase [Pseudomonadota bacterium]
MNRIKPGVGGCVMGLNRRQFVQGLAMGGAIAGFGLKSACLNAATRGSGNPYVLTGNHFRLSIGYRPVNFTGKERIATAVNGSVPAPVLRWKEGEEISLAVTNNLAHDTSIHWHGIILPSAMDGVPYVSDNYPGIPPGATFNYRFKLNQSGTYWYHSHSGFQEQTGLYGAIVVDPVDADPVSYDRDYVIVLSDWTDEKPERLYAKLKKNSDYYNFAGRTVGDLHNDIKQKGVARTWADRKMWNMMRMSDRDISDVSGYTYTFLMNGQTPAEGWKGLFKSGEKVRLRIINAAAMTFFDVRIPGLDMKVVTTDGQNMEPVTVEEIRIGVAETYDVVVEPHDDTAYTIFAQAIDRTGYARGTLTPDPALTAPIPDLDGQPILSHSDMGMDMSAMGHDMSSMGNDMSYMDHDMSSMKGMDHSKMSMGRNAGSLPMGSGPAGFGSKLSQPHVPTEFGPHIDMRADNAQYRLDDPGVGLRNNGRKVLLYSQICNLYPTPDPREPGREINLHLTGNMNRYMWSINGIRFADAEPLMLKYGERVRINLINDTMMNHPIHLHGMWSDMETGVPERIPRKHTIIVQPGAKISYLVTADAMGGWAFHCHLLYHMLGMFRKVEVLS